MKIVLNRSYGGFHYPEALCKEWGIDAYEWVNYDLITARTETALIQWIEDHPEEAEDLEVVEIPENVTDWHIHDYDGLESIICVIDGKIVWL